MFLKETVRYSLNKDSTLLELEYKGRETCLVIYMPSNLKMPRLSIADQLSVVKKFPEKAKVYLPRFESKYSVEMKDIFQKLGVTRIFEESDDFQKISKESVSVSSIFHKTYIKVDEEGTEATGVTGIMVGITSMMPKPLDIVRIDKPFFYTIYDKKNDLILFSGFVANID